MSKAVLLKDRPVGFFNKRSGLCVGLLCLLIGVVVQFQFLTFQNVFLFKDIGSDTINAFYPDMLHISDTIRQWGIPRWSFNVGLGQNIFPGELQNIFTWPLLLLGRGRLAFGIAYVELLKIVLTGLLFFRYLRLLRCSIYPSMIGAVLMAFSGYMMIGTGWWMGHSTFVVTSIFVLFAFEKAFVQKEWLWLPVAVVLAANARLPFLVVFVVLYTCFRYVDETPLKRDQGVWGGFLHYGKNFILLVCQLAFYSLLGLAMNAFFLSGLVQRILQSPRVGGEFGYANVLSATPWLSLASAEEYITILARLFSNDLLGCGSAFRGWGNYLEAPAFYCGLATLILVPQIFFLKSSRRRWASVAFLMLWVLIPLLPRLRYAFYFYSGDYYKGGLSLFVPLVLVVMAMRSLNEIIHSDRRRGRLVALGATLLALLGGFLFLFLLNPAGLFLPLFWLAIVLLFLHGVLLGRMMIRAKRKVALCWFFVLVLFEATLFSFCSVNFRETVSGEEQRRTMAGYNDGTMEAVAKIKEMDDGFFRVTKDYNSGSACHRSFNDSQAQGYYGVSCYNSFNQTSYIDFLVEMGLIKAGNETASRWVSGVGGLPHLESLLSVKYRLFKKEEIPLHVNQLYEEFFRVGDIRVMRNRATLPLCFVYTNVVSKPQIQSFSSHGKQRAALYAAIVEDISTTEHLGVPSGFASLVDQPITLREYFSCVRSLREQTVPCVEFSQNNPRFVSFQKMAGVLFFSIPYDPGWRAIVNGKRMEMERVNYGFLGLCLPPGEHVVELRFSPSGFWIALAVSVAGILMYIGLCVRKRTMSKKNG